LSCLFFSCQFLEGFKIAQRALAFENGSLKARLHQLVGLGYSRMAQKGDLETMFFPPLLWLVFDLLF